MPGYLHNRITLEHVICYTRELAFLIRITSASMLHRLIGCSYLAFHRIHFLCFNIYQNTYKLQSINVTLQLSALKDQNSHREDVLSPLIVYWETSKSSLFCCIIVAKWLSKLKSLITIFRHFVYLVKFRIQYN